MKNATAERPTTQQGLGGLKSAFRGPQRQIQDKSYFQGILRTKMTEINSEMMRLKNAIERNRKEQQSLPTLENKVKELAAEITGWFSNEATINYEKKLSSKYLSIYFKTRIFKIISAAIVVMSSSFNLCSEAVQIITNIHWF